MTLSTSERTSPSLGQAPQTTAHEPSAPPPTPPAPAPAVVPEDQQLLPDPQDLDDLDFLLDEIEDQIAPLA